jgi:outer membrane protein OmpA-like peptidoglycan-associated protein
MAVKLIRGLALWAGALALILLPILPLALFMRLVSMACVCIAVGMVWRWAGRRAASQRKHSDFTQIASLPPASYRQPLILVCGDGLNELFGEHSSGQSTIRLSAGGCYISVPVVERLPQLTASVLALRPDWGAQLSVMWVVNPTEQSDAAMLAGRARALCHQLTLARKQAATLPLLLVSYLEGLHSEGEWFSWETGHHNPVVRHDGGCVSLSAWQQQLATGDAYPHRLQTAVRLKSIAAWVNESVAPHFAAETERQRAETPIAFAVTFVASSPAHVATNLWQQWLCNKAALMGPLHPSPSAAAALPFPNPMLALLPRHTGYTAGRRAGVLALWMFVAASVAALINSGWQNTLLLRHVSDDLRRYRSTDTSSHRSQSGFALREQALQVLRQHAQKLDDYYRHGEPLSLGLGLYRAERARGLLWDVIGSYHPPLAEKVERRPEPVRLDSLSLFKPGSAELKPGSTKVLINALVDIKAQTGWLIVVTGHTDSTGNPEQNLHLSRARAAAVRDWMQRMGDIPDSCFAVQGFAAGQPIASNDTEQGRAANRRVDIRLIPEEGACVLLAAASDKQPLSHSATVDE